MKERKGHSDYDCVVPVSGGKDSTWQTLKILESGLKPLCVTWKTPGRNSLGSRNLSNLISLGVDHFDITINPKVDGLVVRSAFEDSGSPAIPMHRLIRGLPLAVAQAHNIPFVFDGENSAYQYGGEAEDFGFYMTNQWLARYGVVGSLNLESLKTKIEDRRDIKWYEIPNLDLARSRGTWVIFSNYFFKWSTDVAFSQAFSRGFESAASPKTGIWEFADIDDDFIIPVHHWMKWFKFGFTRRWDNLSIDIREGKLTRDEAIEFLQSNPEEEPTEAISLFLDYTGLTRQEFDSVCEKFRNPKIWSRNRSGRWEIRDFLIPDYRFF